MKTKEDIVKKINDLYVNNKYVVVVDFKGLNAKDTSMFRGDLVTKCGSRLLVVKNTLNRVAAKGTDFEPNVNFKGQCGVIFCNDLLKVSKVLGDFCFKDEKVKLVACLNKGDVVASEQIKELAFLPPMEVLKGKLLCALNAVGSSLVRVLAERGKQQDSKQES